MKRGLYSVLLIIGGLLVFAQTSINIDNTYTDWAKVPALVSFSRLFDPTVFTLEKKSEKQNITIDKSQYWMRNGTQLKEIRSLQCGDKIFFYLETYTDLKPGLSVFFYFYPDRSKKLENNFTLEVMVADHPAVLLWQKGTSTPKQVGVLKVADNKLEFALGLTELPKSILASFDSLSVDLTTVFFDEAAGFYEEFYLTSFYMKDIPID